MKKNMNSQNNYRIKSCRICDNSNLKTIGSLGNIAISDFTEKPEQGVKYPLELVYCSKCSLVQLAHNTPRDLLYKNYWYESHLNPVVVNDLKSIAEMVKHSIIDIGSNDGTLLKYVDPVVYKVAVDPSQFTSPTANINIQDYWENVQLTGKYSYITAIACLYDLPDPNKFIRNVKRYLDKKGVFISQFQPLSEMVELNDVGNICHEHLEYYSYKSLVKLFEKNGLEIYKVEKNQMNGGSYRIFSRHYKTGSVVFKEKEYSYADLQAFFERIEKHKTAMIEFLRILATEIYRKGKSTKIYGYGASTKGNTILQYYLNHNNLSKIIGGIVDINPQKIGKYTIATDIPIIDTIPKDADFLWVFPYGFINYFKKKEKEYKGNWITTIPEYKIS